MGRLRRHDRVAEGWRTFDLTTVHGFAKGFNGGVFDGRYVYFVPFVYQAAGVEVPSGRVGRYDTQAPFDVASSWSTFDTSTVNPAALDFNGGVFDGRYLYLVPATKQYTRVARYDTTAAFGTAAAWSTFDVSQLGMPVYGFLGGVFDGEHVYLVPSGPPTPTLRFDAKTPPSMPPSYRGSFY